MELLSYRMDHHAGSRHSPSLRCENLSSWRILPASFDGLSFRPALSPPVCRPRTLESAQLPVATVARLCALLSNDATTSTSTTTTTIVTLLYSSFFLPSFLGRKERPIDPSIHLVLQLNSMRRKQNDNNNDHHNENDPTLFFPNRFLIFNSLMYIDIGFFHIISSLFDLKFNLI